METATGCHGDRRLDRRSVPARRPRGRGLGRGAGGGAAALPGGADAPARRDRRGAGPELRRRLLVVVGRPVEDPRTTSAIAAEAGIDGSRDLAEVLILAPARIGFLDRWASDLEPARREAQETLVISVASLAKAGVVAEARVGDEDIVQAVEDQVGASPRPRSCWSPAPTPTIRPRATRRPNWPRACAPASAGSSSRRRGLGRRRWAARTRKGRKGTRPSRRRPWQAVAAAEMAEVAGTARVRAGAAEFVRETPGTSPGSERDPTNSTISHVAGLLHGPRTRCGALVGLCASKAPQRTGPVEEPARDPRIRGGRLAGPGLRARIRTPGPSRATVRVAPVRTFPSYVRQLRTHRIRKCVSARDPPQRSRTRASRRRPQPARAASETPGSRTAPPPATSGRAGRRSGRRRGWG